MEKLACRLTTRDFSMLETMLHRGMAVGDPIVPLLQAKLAGAEIMPLDAIGAGIVTLNSRVVFRVDAGPAETRTLVRHDMRGAVGVSLPVSTMRGLAMLGLAEGETISIERTTGRPESILIEKVLYQPEAARRQFAPKAAAPPARRPALTLVHSVAAHGSALGEMRKIRQTAVDGNDDDPGPSAA